MSVVAAACRFCTIDDVATVRHSRLDRWSVGTISERPIPGWMLLWSDRHFEDLSEGTAEELASLGPILARVSNAIGREVDAERVYITLFADRTRHVHFLLAALPRGYTGARRAAALIADSDELRDPASFRIVGEAVGRLLEAGR